MRIIIDAMGGDNAPHEIVKGAVAAQREFKIDITLVGKEEAVTPCLRNEGVAPADLHFDVVDAREVIDMEDDASTATRSKKDSSMAVALKLLSDGEGDAVISAGNTGALLTGATLTVKRIKGIRRAALAPVFPVGEKGAMLIDCGANVECTPEYLMQFAYMGSHYARAVLGYAAPRIGLLNVGTEETKGGDLQKEAYKLLKKASEAGKLNFIGNIEARDVLFGAADVIVTDGFTGNILLKSIEGSVAFLMSELKKLFYKSAKAKLAAGMIKNDLQGLKTMFDVNEVGGTALLGISKTVIKAHGSSDARAVRSAAKQAITFIKKGVIDGIVENIDEMRVEKSDLSISAE